MPEEFDRFADDLDRMVAGQSPAGDGDLAAFARQIQGFGEERIDDEQRDMIRRRLMQHAMSANTPTTGGAGPLLQPTLTDPAMSNPWVRRTPVADRTPSGWRGHMVKAQTAIAIMAAVALLIVGAAWYTNQQGGEGPPPSATRYAAAPTESVGDPQNLSMQGPRPVGTPEIDDDMDAAWWTWPSGDECRPDELPSDTLEPADYPERAYLPLDTPDRQDAESAAYVARMMAACNVHYSIAPFSSSRYYEENYTLLDDPYDYGQTLLEQNENGRAIAEAFPITDPTEFGRLTTEEPAEAPPFWLQGQLEVNRYEPYTVVFIPSQAVELADGRIAIPESLLDPEEDMDQARRGDPATWPLHYAVLVVLSDASGTWLIDEILPFCIGPDCDFYWDQNEELAHRVLAGATPEAPVETPAATPKAALPVDDRVWLACPEYDGPFTYASREGVTSDIAPSGAFDPRSSWGPAEPPSIPCDYPAPEPPEIGNPIPLD
jgi:hypothetical protein